MKFDLPKDQSSIIKVIGVGGGGGNAVNHMFNQGITGVDFLICNTDAQVLAKSPITNKIQLGTTLTEGLGAGANPEVGKNAAIEDIEEIKSILQNNTKMVFITAGMGGGTGTGAAPVIAQTAREMGILTVGIVTMPFSFEGRRRRQQAEDGVNLLRKHVDTLLVINNDKLRMIHGNLKMSECFSKADDILTVAAKGIAEIITVAGYINVDFEDVKTVMKDGGTAIMGSAMAEGENRAIQAVSKALESPLLNDNEINGANHILLNVTSGNDEITMDEIDEITEFIQKQAGYTAQMIWGNGTDESLGNKIAVTVIATGFGINQSGEVESGVKSQKIVHDLDNAVEVVQSITEVLPQDSIESELEEPFLKIIETQSAINFEKSEVTLEANEESEVIGSFESEKTIYNLEEEIEESVAEINEEILADFVEEEEEVNEEVDEFKFELKVDEPIAEEEDTFTYESSSVAESAFDDANESPFLMSTEEESAAEKNIIKWDLNEIINEDSSNIEMNADEIEEVKSAEEFSLFTNKEEQKPVESVYTKRIPEEDQKKLSAERMKKIKDLGSKMKTPSGISELEKEPAYKRRQITLDTIPHSSENNVSRFTLSDDEGAPKLKDNNSFIHDNVD